MITGKQLTEALELLRDYQDYMGDTPCRFDHHGYCQEHCWLDESECPVSRLERLMKEIDDG